MIPFKMPALKIAGGLAACVLAAQAQNPSPAAQARAQAEQLRAEAEKMRTEAQKVSEEWKENLKFEIKNRIGAGLGNGIEEITRNVIELAQNFPFDYNGKNSDFGDSYQSGQQALDRRNYDQAIRRFDQAIAAKSSRSDGAMYWKAYAQHRSGKRDQALATLAELEKQYPQSRWLNDARALAAEARAGAPSPDAQSDEELKLLALNSLIHQEPERAIPVLEKILGDTKSSPSLKRQALFVLARSRSPKAAEILTQYAKGGANPDLQARAIEYLGTARSADNAQTLASLYSSSDAATKKEVIRALRRQDAAKQLVELARKESDAGLKKDLVRELSSMKSKDASDYLMELLSK